MYANLSKQTCSSQRSLSRSDLATAISQSLIYSSYPNLANFSPIDVLADGSATPTALGSRTPTQQNPSLRRLSLTDAYDPPVEASSQYGLPSNPSLPLMSYHSPPGPPALGREDRWTLSGQGNHARVESGRASGSGSGFTIPALLVAAGWLHGSQLVTSKERYFCPLHCGEWIDFTQGEGTYDQQVALHAQAFCDRPGLQPCSSHFQPHDVGTSRDIDPQVIALHRTASYALAVHAAAIAPEISQWHAEEDGRIGSKMRMLDGKASRNGHLPF